MEACTYHELCTICIYENTLELDPVSKLQNNVEQSQTSIPDMAFSLTRSSKKVRLTIASC
jgi:hypothetical protein